VQAGLGFQARTGWAALLAVAGPLDEPVVADRRRVELVDDEVPAHVYHAAQEAGSADGGALVRKAERTAHALSRAAVRTVTRDLDKAGFEIVGIGLGVAEPRLPAKLEDVLASHALVHAAEGELYRHALIRAGESCRLPVACLPRQELATHAAKELGLRGTQMQAQVTRMGREIGPPWRQEQKWAALAAWVSLARGWRSR
jgi:hypothetical protein